jgi:two-component system, chemotaxis family, response regulator Rcp1
MDERKKGKPIDILLVEDSPGDVRLVEEAFKEFRFCNALFVVNDGAEATDFLNQKGKYADVPLPDLILLDLNLPKKDGYQVLREIKSDEKLKTIPVIVLTVSKSDEDILKSYKLQANCFISKPVDVNEFFKTMQSIEDFWLTIVKFPPKSENSACF